MRSLNTSKHLNIFFLAIFVLTTTFCTENFSSINKPKDRISTDNIDASLLGQAFAQTEYGALTASFQVCQSLHADLYTQYFSSTVPYFSTDNYAESAGYDNDCWNAFYGDVAPQINYVENFTSENNLSLQNAFMKVWKVHSYQRITDYWGPIIYSEFGNGKEIVPYDSQEEIYNDFFTTLDEAVKVLKENMGSSAYPSDDLLYEGNVNKWLTFANSLRLRAAMRIRFVEPELAQKEAERAVEDGVMQTNEDNAMLTVNANSKNRIPTVEGYGEFRMSASMESLLEGYEDPRKGEYFSPALNGDQDGDGSPYEGLRNGLTNKKQSEPDINDNHSRMGPRYLGTSNPPIKVMQAAEVYFLRAEGALAGWDMGENAKELYNEGIRKSIEVQDSDVSDSQIKAYINSTNTAVQVGDSYNSPAVSSIPVAFGLNAEQKLEQIITQKWIALYPNGWEAWAEQRRTGYPILYPLIDNRNPKLSAGRVVRRLSFVTGEYNNNNKAVEDAAKNLLDGSDDNSTNVWWDVK